MLPSIFGDNRFFGENLFDDWFAFPFDRELRGTEKKLYGKNAAHVMKTDIREGEDSYEILVDLPGFKKEDVTISLENGYLTVGASKTVDQNEENKKGQLIRQERYSGSMQRSFYVGEAVTEEDIRAKMEHGLLTLTVPKREAKKLPEKKTIAIE
ncbi:MAG: Hsp20/alpha crystallin family protein [Clostridia bacterium]|nr:Hsp20/alpha crystallin family protein [Clostridia bacterium]